MISNKNKPAVVEGSIGSLAFGGDGVMRHQGQVVFVPFTAPEDLITAQIINDKKSYAKAKLLEILSTSSLRVDPSCTYFGMCGGCQFQHINYDAQAHSKEIFVADALQRLGGFSDIKVNPIIKADGQWHYRRHIRLHILGNNNSCNLGFVKQDNHSLLEIEHCPIFDIKSAFIIKALRNMCNFMKAPTGKKVGGVSIFKADSNSYVLFFDFYWLPQALPELLANLYENNSQIKGIIWRHGETYQHMGEYSLSFELGGLKLIYNPKAFVQAHPEQSAKLYLDLKKQVLDLSTSKPILDLYCGLGATALLIAKNNTKILGVELNPEAIKLAQENAVKNNITVVKFYAGDVDTLSHDLFNTHKPDVVIINPPRTGLGDGIKKTLLSFLPKHIFYISCMPATLARDLAILSKSGYKIITCQPYDMFPQTTHVETLVHCTFN